MHKWQTRIRFRRLLQFRNRLVILLAIQRRLPHQQMIFRRVFPQFHKSRQGPLLYLPLPHLVRRVPQHVQIIQVSRLVRPDRIQRPHRIPIPLRKKITKPQQITRLRQPRLLPHHRFKRPNRPPKIILPVINQSNIQTNPRHPRRQLLCLPQHFQSMRPLLTPHRDHAQILISPRRPRFRRQNFPERPLRPIQFPSPQSRFPLRKNPRQIRSDHRARVLARRLPRPPPPPPAAPPTPPPPRAAVPPPTPRISPPKPKKKNNPPPQGPGPRPARH